MNLRQAKGDLARSREGGKRVSPMERIEAKVGIISLAREALDSDQDMTLKHVTAPKGYASEIAEAE